MPSERTDAFLSGRGIAVPLDAVERTLSDLWGPAAELVGGSEAELPPVTRVVLANLVVATVPAEAGRVADSLDAIVARFPCRSIVVVLGDDAGEGLDAEVAALCHLPAPGLPQVCSERILLRAGRNSLDLVPGAVRPLLEPDLPVVLWWTSDPTRHERLFRDLADEATRVLVDLAETDRAALALGLDPSINPFSRDTAWFGATGWRDLVAQCFDPADRVPLLGRLSRVEIAAVSPAPDVPCRQALWLAAWLAGQLGWRRGDDGRFQGPRGPVDLVVEAGVDPAEAETRVTGVRLTAVDETGASTFHLRRVAPGSTDVRTTLTFPNGTETCRDVRLPEIEPARRVSAGLESSRVDPPFARALPIFLDALERPFASPGLPFAG